MQRFLRIALLCAGLGGASAWVTPTSRVSSTRTGRKVDLPNRVKLASTSTAAAQVEAPATAASTAAPREYLPVLDFRNASAIDALERLDDAIMGGISTSRVAAGSDCARWVGVCRTDGGGFCGFRTNPFRQPIHPGPADGFYLLARLVSDADVDRRVWKFSTRVRPDRGELLYQAPVVWPSPPAATPPGPVATASTSGSADTDATSPWTRIEIPFSSFRLVRGPKFVASGPPLNTTGGLYQLGMTMSQFEFGGDLKAIDNFRDGFYELQIQEIGLYKETEEEMTSSSWASSVSFPQVMAKEEAKKNRPLLLKALKPVSKIFFSEQSQRRKQAMKLLQKKQGLSRVQAMLFGLRYRVRNFGWPSAIAKTLYILLADTARTILQWSLKLTFVYPLRLLQKSIKLFSDISGGKSKKQSDASKRSQ